MVWNSGRGTPETMSNELWKENSQETKANNNYFIFEFTKSNLEKLSPPNQFGKHPDEIVNPSG